jgi:hypothetical protein
MERKKWREPETVKEKWKQRNIREKETFIDRHRETEIKKETVKDRHRETEIKEETDKDEERRSKA